MNNTDLTKHHYFKDGDHTTDHTTLHEIAELADKLLKLTWTMDMYRSGNAPKINLHELGWKFQFNDRKRAAGLCNYTKKTVYVSRWLLKQNLDKAFEFENTLRHELAHAMDNALGKRSNHGPHWVAVAKHMKCTGDRCYSPNVIQIKVTTKYTLICDTCGKESPSHKVKKRKTACGDCCNTHNYGRYSLDYVLRQVKNY
jgi:predicted SprT family Zn-dependent metalloprotease